ncbi:MAG: phosphatidate cytidylyltransferase [Gammaproteobacteria bacterium]|nr:phosphatidate cytidylyltransferase [Gammaproteobacteria bacterium]
MLQTRVLTALVIFPVTLAVVFLSPPLVFKGIVAILLLGGCREFARISDLSARGTAALVFLQALVFAAMFIAWESLDEVALPLLTLGCLAWLALFLRLSAYQRDARPDIRFRRMGFASALISLSFCWFALCWLQDRPQGDVVVFMLLLIIWASDTGAYFSGRQFGRRKLAPVISPNKTWEGVYGGVALALLAAWLWSGPIMDMGLTLPSIATITIITAMASIGGDLFISLHKRTVKLADAGKLFPGHGGVLDRYDSLLAGVPFFALAYGLMAL